MSYFDAERSMMDRRKPGHREWRHARWLEYRARKFLEKGNRKEFIRFLVDSRRWRFAAYKEGFEPRKNNRGRTPNGLSEFERWWASRTEPQRQEVIERRWAHEEKLKHKNAKLYQRGGFDMSAAFERKRNRQNG